jgi:hypothetical protein
VGRIKLEGRLGIKGRSGWRESIVGPPPRRRMAGDTVCNCQAEQVVLEERGVPGSCVVAIGESGVSGFGGGSRGIV